MKREENKISPDAIDTILGLLICGSVPRGCCVLRAQEREGHGWNRFQSPTNKKRREKERIRTIKDDHSVGDGDVETESSDTGGEKEHLDGGIGGKLWGKETL